MRVERSFAFVDLCGFTAFTDRQPDDRVVLVLAQLRTALRETAARRGVRVVKWLGDGAMLSTPDTHALVGLVLELDARMAEALPQLPIRAGLATGPVIMFEGDDYIGRSVNLASRLCSEAQPREILASDDVLAATPCWVESGPRREVHLRGLDAPAAVNPLRVRSAPSAIVDVVCGLTIPTDCVTDWAGDAGFCGLGCYEAWQERRPA